MNRGNIRDEIRRIVQDTDTDTTRQRWTDTILNDRIDQAHDKIASLTKCIKSRITDDIVSAQSEYDLPSYFVEADSVMWLDSSGYWIPLQKKSETELDTENGYWRNITGSTLTHYYIRRNKIGVYPQPDFARSSALRVDIARRPTTFSGDTSIPFDGDYTLYPYHDILAYEVASKCKFDELKYDEANRMAQEVQAKMREIKYQVNNTADQTRIPNIYEAARQAPRRTR